MLVGYTAVSTDKFVFFLYLGACFIGAIVFTQFEMPWIHWLGTRVSYVGSIFAIVILWLSLVLVVIVKRNLLRYMFLTIWVILMAGMPVFHSKATGASLLVALMAVASILSVRKWRSNKISVPDRRE